MIARHQRLRYIAEKLKKPKAANDLLDKVERAILERLPIAESFEPYRTIRERQYTYYRIYVDNYIVYYVVSPPVQLEEHMFIVDRLESAGVIRVMEHIQGACVPIDAEGLDGCTDAVTLAEIRISGRCR